MDGGGRFPLDEIAAGYAADFSQRRRNDSRARVLLVSGATVAQGIGGPSGTQNVETGMGGRIRHVDNIIEMEVAIGGKGYVFRGQTSGVAGKVFQACGVALPPALRPC